MSNWQVCSVTENSILQRQREKLGLTQEEVAKRAGVTLKQYLRYEKKGVNISSSSSFRIASAVLTALELDPTLYKKGDYVYAPLSDEENEELRRKFGI